MRPYGEGRFNSRAPRGARPRNRCRRNTVFSFNSRAPRGARRLYSVTPIQAFLFQFTCPSRSTTDGRSNDRVMHSVSIHVPLAEHDSVSIHVPLAEHDQAFPSNAGAVQFQFTCPSRSTTLNPDVCAGGADVSIHVPLAEHDSSAGRLTASASVFQFTCPSRSTTLTCRSRLNP